MTPEMWQRLKALYEASLEASPEQRADLLANAYALDKELGQELEALLKSSGEGTSTLDEPIIDFRNLHLFKEHTLLEGTVLLERFKVVRHLGSGGMGNVYEVEDSFLRGVHLAMKTLLPFTPANPQLQKQFEREVLLAREVVHSNLCPIYDIFHCDEPRLLFLTMKLLPGGTLGARLRQEAPIPVEDGVCILRNLALGLTALHDAGIVHRDIKPSNVMLEGTGADLRLWITDFGLAHAYQAETTISGRGTVAGTPGYIAPELYLGHAPSQASDLFAFGVLLHEVFTGEKPSLAADGRSYAVGAKLISPKIPAYCVQLITECLSSDPRLRCRAFERAMQTIDPAARRHSSQSSALWTRRRFVATAATGVCAVAGGAWWKRDDLENAAHPLPQKRFVALLNWPKSADGQIDPTLTGVLSAIKGQLARLEALDHNLFVISPEDAQIEVSAASHLKEISDPLGTNLVLAAAATPRPGRFELLLRVIDPASNRAIREKRLLSSPNEITSLPSKAVRAAGSLLNLSSYMRTVPQADPGTRSPEAFAAFQAAEEMMKQPNDSGLDEAIDKYKQAVELDPGYALGHARLAETYIHYYGLTHEPGALTLARGNSEHALALDPSLVDGRIARALLLENTGEEKDALGELMRALALDPSNPWTLSSLAEVYIRLNRWEDAEQTYERILSQRPNYWVTYNDKGYVLDRQGKYLAAIQAFRAATVAAPRNSMAYANLGSEYLQVGDFGAATDALKKSQEIKPSDLAAANTSLSLRYQGRFAEALPFALKAVELNSAEDVNWLELGDCYSSLGPHHREDAKQAYSRAVKETERHLQTDPNDGPAWMLLALYQSKSGSPQNALAQIKKAEDLGAGDLESQLCKARILELIGKRDEALTTLTACFQRGATTLQVAPFPELQALRKDKRYWEITRSNRISPGATTTSKGMDL